MGEEKIDLMDVLNDDMQYTEVPKEVDLERKDFEESQNRRSSEGLVNCLRKELITAKLVIRDTSITDKRHPYYGGKADGTYDIFTVPLLRNGALKNPLTREEKDFLEDYMGLEPNALSVHNTKNNFWENRQVIIDKEGAIFDLSTPMGYINYKILLANTDTICPSIELLKKRPKATYRYVLASDKQVYDATVEKVSTKSKCWKLYGKVEDNPEVLRSIIETFTGVPTDAKSSIEFLQESCVELLENNPKLFLDVISDPLLEYKVTIRQAVEKNVIVKRGDWYYYNNVPLCAKNENPTLTIAAKYISNPKNQEILFSIQDKLK